MVDPDVVAVAECNGIATPDVLGVELCDVDILDDDIFSAIDAETFSTKNGLITDTD